MHVFETEYCVEPSHPSLVGHFPGNPVVPGVVILDAVVRALTKWQPGMGVAGFPNTKFVSPLLPGERLGIKIELREEAGAAFKCTVAERLVAQGKLKLQRKAG